ncbi:MAG: HPr(Ser) kinase/phosphatase [Spirochaetota bacterium]|nr:HPr(Ser) kinase/phosphatase [Spirochaetota bacterium]
MKKEQIFIKDLIDNSGHMDLMLKIFAGEKGLNKEITGGEVNRPGLSLAGFFDFFAFERIQIFGLGETAFISNLSDDQKKNVYEKFFSYDILCCIFTHDVKPDKIFIDFANKKNIPTLVTKFPTTRFISLLTHVLEEVFSPSTTIHGTLVDVFGLGVLLLGESGAGKSESALELVERGHRLVADDMVEVQKTDESFLIGSSSAIIAHHMEIRGLGIINVRDIFGIRSVRNRKRIELIILLEDWDPDNQYDRLGIDEQKYNILGIDVSYVVIPVKPGRNIPVIIETAALNHRLKKMGIYSAKELDNKIQNMSQKEN